MLIAVTVILARLKTVVRSPCSTATMQDFLWYDLTMDTQKAYELKRDALAQQYKELRPADRPVRLKKSVSNLFRERLAPSVRLDVRQFSKVIHIDPVNLTADVEGMTTYRALVDATLAHGLLPAVVPELATITVGGAVSGGGIEASSFRFGLVHETVLAMDVLLPNGKVITATAQNSYRDLFYGLANSFGTLGYILKATIMLVPAKQFVQLQHHRFTTMSSLLHMVEEIAHTHTYQGRAVDFMDGVGFDAKELYLTIGYFTEDAPVPPSNYRYLRQYYRSIQHKTEDYLTARDFIWRWDSDWFWCSKNFYMNRPIPRALFGKWLLRSEAYWRLVRLDQRLHIDRKLRQLTRRPANLEDVIQDVQIPLEKAKSFWRVFLREVPIRPVWFCPTRSATSDQYPLYQLQPNQTYINFGFWDHVAAHPEDPHYYNKFIETVVQRYDGKKGLYSKAYYDKHTFWQLYNGGAYTALKEKYDPDYRLRDLYQKSVEQG
jgi:FAD/FMN-containing dehydrogenase